ncbi:hypothetical protein SACE_7008 [Saccharopolyspora erythraea prophage pSE211]|uniref:Uncharacterized protein n=1 Tax=Saccharopolyspora erythraea (strain ATCC 11635 / DSM 40517 / JCM 4748 / NBRC 13426 / NCIMB 8594 / NRRL 2338) TaxID=405948 RepID=A4FQ44_SACEN|nr:hypothetical protein SACE_7008 [Saccharopolyspora erythraea NRRL 2338]
MWISKISPRSFLTAAVTDGTTELASGAFGSLK